MFHHLLRSLAVGQFLTAINELFLLISDLHASNFALRVGKNIHF